MKTLQQILNEKKHKEVISIAPNRPVFDALVILAEYKIGALAVIEEGKLVGIFSERDYAREVILKGRSSKTTQVAEVMTDKVIFGKADDLVESAMSMMSEKRIRHLPVLNGEELLGMLSLGDLVKETI
ncbi:MAG: histidine kinase, partial [Methylotenera sp.]